MVLFYYMGSKHVKTGLEPFCTPFLATDSAFPIIIEVVREMNPEVIPVSTLGEEHPFASPVPTRYLLRRRYIWHSLTFTGSALWTR